MSVNFVIHAGAGKCGSTAIQTAILHLQKYQRNLAIRLLDHRAIHELDVAFASGRNVDHIIDDMAGCIRSGTIVISSEYLLSRPFALASLFRELRYRTTKVRIVCCTRHPYGFAISAFRYFFRHTPTIVDYIKSSPVYHGNPVLAYVKPELLFAMIEMNNNFRFLAAGVPNHMLWKESLRKVETACGLGEEEAKNLIKVVSIPDEPRGFDIVKSFLRASNIKLRIKANDYQAAVRSNAGPDPWLVNSLLHYQLAGRLSMKLRIHDHARSEIIMPTPFNCPRINAAERALKSLFARQIDLTQRMHVAGRSPLQVFEDSLCSLRQSFHWRNLIRQLCECSSYFENYYIPLELVEKVAIVSQ